MKTVNVNAMMRRMWVAMSFFLRIRAWKAGQEKKKKEPRRAYIDEVWGNLKPA